MKINFLPSWIKPRINPSAEQGHCARSMFQQSSAVVPINRTHLQHLAMASISPLSCQWASLEREYSLCGHTFSLLPRQPRIDLEFWRTKMHPFAEEALCAGGEVSPAYVENLQQLSVQIFKDHPLLPGQFTLRQAYALTHGCASSRFLSIKPLVRLAKQVWKEKTAFERQIIEKSPQVIHALERFLQIHDVFAVEFTEAAMNQFPYTAFAIRERFPEIVAHFKKALTDIQPNREKILECDADCIEKVGRLGLFLCLMGNESGLKFLFSGKDMNLIAYRIATLQGQLKGMSPEDLQAFRNGFLTESFSFPSANQIIGEIYKQISALFYEINRDIFSSITSLVFV